MAEYIKKKDLVEFVCRHVDGKLDANDIARFPTTDVVEVVRCKDCKHFLLHRMACINPFHNGWCTINDYCSYGERKTNDE